MRISNSQPNFMPVAENCYACALRWRLPEPMTSAFAPQLRKQCCSDWDLMLKLRNATSQPSLQSPNQTQMKSASLLISSATVSPCFRPQCDFNTLANLLLRASASLYERICSSNTMKGFSGLFLACSSKHCRYVTNPRFILAFIALPTRRTLAKYIRSCQK